MRKGFWDRQGANIASRWKEINGLKLFFFFVKNFDFGKRMTFFRRYIIRNGVEQS